MNLLALLKLAIDSHEFQVILIKKDTKTYSARRQRVARVVLLAKVSLAVVQIALVLNQLIVAKLRKRSHVW